MNKLTSKLRHALVIALIFTLAFGNLPGIALADIVPTNENITQENEESTQPEVDNAITAIQRTIENFEKASEPIKISKFLPAPGQFVNKAPWGLDPEAILSGGVGVSLGSFGGYVIFEFDESIKNDPNNPYGVDLTIYGNAFQGFEEPGGVQVMTKDDDTWYDIAGSEHYEDDTIVDYEVTYTNPDPDFSEGALDIPWTDNQGITGIVPMNNFHKQSYFPNPDNYNTDTFNISNKELKYSGVKLNKKDPAFGYVDVYGNGKKEVSNPYTESQQGAPIDIGWAVDKDGQPVEIDEIKYVKVYTGVLMNAGGLGEVSTEVTDIVRAKADDEIGVTEDLSEIKLQTSEKEIVLELEADKYSYDINVAANSVKVLANGDADNLYINNEKVAMKSASESVNLDMKETKTIRLIAQDEKDNPKIYYLNVKQVEEPKEPEINKSKLEKVITDAKAVDLDKKTEDSVKDLQATLKEAEIVFAEADTTQNEVDQITKTLEKSISNLKERAPPTTVNVRVEGNGETLVSSTKVAIEPFDLMEYINDNNSGKPMINDSPRAIHAIIRALETIDGLDPKSDDDFGLGFGGNYIQHVGNEKELSGPMSGWMYTVDNVSAPVGPLDYELKNDESVVLYFVENFTDSTFSWFDSESYSTKVGKSLEIELSGDSNGSVKDATILVDEKGYEVDNKVVQTGEDGIAKLKFDEPGTYHLSATRVNEAGEVNIVRPYAVVKVVEDDEIEEPPAADTVPPVITVVGIKDGQKVLKDKVNFTVEAKDEIDGIVDATVTLNKEVAKANNTGEFNVQLNEGENTIVVNATDKSNNTATKKFTITYKPVELNPDVEKAINQVMDYVLNKDISSEWEVIGLSRAGKKIPASYLAKFNDKIEKEITKGLKNGQFKITDAERLAIAAVAIGKDPKNINGHSLIELIYNSPDRTMWDGTVKDTMTYQGNNGLAFALISLDANKHTIPKDAKWSRQAIIDELLRTQLDDGSWSLNEAYPTSSIDVTAIALTGMAPYQDQPDVKVALDKAVSYLSKTQVSEGGFDGGKDVGGITSEATAQVIIGLTAYGIDPTSEQFTKDGNNLIDHLLSYQTVTGGFTHTHNYSDVNELATEQSLQALVSYQLFVKDEGGLYDFTEIEAVIDTETNQGTDPNPKPNTNQDTNENTDDEDETNPKEETDENGGVSSDKQDADNNLPKTATNIFNLLFIGLALLVLGSIVLFIRRDRASKDN